MKILIYPFTIFEDNFYEKDVILFPKFHSDKNVEPELFVINYESKQNLYKGNKSYLIYLLHLIKFLIKNKTNLKLVYIFHITLRNFPIILACKLFTNAKVVNKADFSSRNYQYFKEKSLLRKTLFSIYLNLCDEVHLETIWLYTLLLKLEPFSKFSDKIFCSPNKVFKSEDEVNQLIKLSEHKEKNSVLFYLRAKDAQAADLKSFHKYIEIILTSPDFFIDKCIYVVADVDGIYKSLLESAINRSTLKIVVMGRLSKALFLVQMAKCEFYILLSKEESFNFSVIEALLSNCKVLTTEVGVVIDYKPKYNMITFPIDRDVSEINMNYFNAISIPESDIKEMIYNL